jgi:hypothetical protein
MQEWSKLERKLSLSRSTQKFTPLSDLHRGSLSDALLKAANALDEAASCVAILDEKIKQIETQLTQIAKAQQQAAEWDRLNSNPSVRPELHGHVTTSVAAAWLNRKPQTLRKWACYEDGPLRPIRVNGRLAWSAADILRIVAPKPA